MAEKKKSCFVIAPIGEEDSETRRRSDQVLKYVITPAVTQQGYEKPVRADKISEAGVITTQVIEQIVEADLVVADLSGHNANVFYELAIRHAIKKPVVLLIEAGEIIPFDVFQNRIIKFNHHDLESVNSCITEMVKLIKKFEDKDQQVETPISMTMELKGWRESSNPIKKGNAEIIAMLQELRMDFRGIQYMLTPINLEYGLIKEIIARILKIGYRVEDIAADDRNAEEIHDNLILISELIRKSAVQLDETIKNSQTKAGEYYNKLYPNYVA